MPNVPIQVVGATYTASSKPVASQVTRNFRLEANQLADSRTSLLPFPGCKPFAESVSGEARGIFKYKGYAYCVIGTKLYEISSSGALTDVGTISGSNRVIGAEDTDNLVLANPNGRPYSFSGVTPVQGTDVDLYTSSTVAYINNRIVYDGANANIIFADLGSPLSVNSANVTSSDNSPDDTIAVHTFADNVFAFGLDSVVPYYNIGSGNPPYRVVQNAVSRIGTIAKYSIASNYRSLYFLGSDLNVYRIGAIQAEPIGNPAITNEIRGYSNPQSAYGVCFTLDSQNYYMLTFPGEATWLYSEGLGWTNLAYGTNGDPHLIYDYCYCYNKHLVQDRRNGHIHELDFDTYTDDGEVIDRQRDTINISGKDFQAPGKEIYMHSLELVVETGTGVITGQGSNPKVMMSFSDDGGRTWSPEQWAEFGVMGSFTYSQNPRWFDLGSFYERLFRFRVSDPAKFAIISANADIEIAV